MGLTNAIEVQRSTHNDELLGFLLKDMDDRELFYTQFFDENKAFVNAVGIFREYKIDQVEMTEVEFNELILNHKYKEAFETMCQEPVDQDAVMKLSENFSDGTLTPELVYKELMLDRYITHSRFLQKRRAW